MVAAERTRYIYNPIQKDGATFLKTAEETNGEYTLIEVELAPYGGNGTHYHKEFSEKFEVLEGELNVQVGDEYFLLKAGDTAVVEPHIVHRFFSTSDQPTRFLVEITPGHVGFEQALCIAYGLAQDGKMNKEGMPTNPFELAHLFVISGTYDRGFVFKVLKPIFMLLAKIAQLRGIDKQLEAKYLQGF